MNSENEIKNWLKRLQEGWATGQAFSWIVEDLDSGKLLGQMTLSKTGGDNRWAMAFWIHPDHRGKGFATDGAERLLAFGFEAVGAEQIWAGAGDWNKGSYRVMEKIGMIFRGVNPIGYYSKGEPILTWEYEISRKDGKRTETFHLGKCNLRIETQNEPDHSPFARRGNVGCPLCVKPIFLAPQGARLLVAPVPGMALDLDLHAAAS